MPRALSPASLPAMRSNRGLIIRVTAIFAAAATALAAAIAPPVKLVFSGVDASAEPVRVVLVDPATQAQAWVPVGGRFAGCEVRGYDARRQMLTLARGADTWDIALDTGGGSARASLSPEEERRISKQVLNNMRQLAAASDQYFLEYGVTTVRMDQLVGDGRDKYIKKIEPVDGEDYTKLNFTQPSPTSPPGRWEITTKRGVTVRYDR